jgi:hypothetical protein
MVKGGTTVTLPAPAPGGQFSANRNKTVSRTAAGELVSYDHGVSFYEANLTFTHLSAANKSDLESLFAAVGSDSFTYTDVGSTAFTAYFLDTALAWRQQMRGLYDVTVRLQLSAAGV